MIVVTSYLHPAQSNDFSKLDLWPEFRSFLAANYSLEAQRQPPDRCGGGAIRRSGRPIAFTCLNVLSPVGILDDVGVGEGDESFCHHLIHDGKKCLELLLSIYHCDGERGVAGEMKGFVFVDAPVGAVSKDAAMHGSSGQIVGAHGLDQSRMEGLALPAVALSDEYLHEFCAALDLYMLWCGLLRGFGNVGGLDHGSFLNFDHGCACQLAKAWKNLFDP